MAGSWATQINTQGFQTPGSVMTKIQLVYTADAADGSVPDETITNCSGFLVFAEHIIGATVPTTAFDITVKNEDSVDLMGGELEDIVTTGGAGTVLAKRPVDSDGDNCGRPSVNDITVSIANNSVNSATGTLNLYFI